MNHITIQQQIELLCKVDAANELLLNTYPKSKRIVCLKLDRAGISVYVHGESGSVDQYIGVDSTGLFGSVDEQLSEVHRMLDSIIEECGSIRISRFVEVA